MLSVCCRLLVAPVFMALLGYSAPAQALKFRTVKDGAALLIYDCGRIDIEGETKDSCLPHERSFSGPTKYKDGSVYPGDAEILSRILSKNSAFARVFLYSGGGNLMEGVKIGEVLRRFNQYVVVPDGHKCVSACTVAYLGGRIRDVEPGGSYEVHAYSGVLDASAEDLESLLGPDAEFELDGFVKSKNTAARDWAKRLLTYVQTMIGGAPSPAAIDSVLARSPDFRSAYMKSGQFREDLEKIRREGAATAQDVLMKIERETFFNHLSQLKKNVPELGTRAQNAIDMLDIMFSSRIAGTYRLDQTTLRERGYINVRRAPN